MVETQAVQETVVPVYPTQAITTDRKREDWMCWARIKTCRICEHRYTREQYDLWHCPACGEDRHCIASKIAGYQRCRVHGGGSPGKGKIVGRPRSHRYTDVLSSDLVRDYRMGLADPDLLALSDEIALCDARKKSLIRRAIECELEDEGKSDGLWNKANRLQEQGRKLRKTETDRRVKLQQYVTKERAVAFTRAIAICHQESLALILDDKLRLQVLHAFEVHVARVMRTSRSDLVDLLVEVPK